MPKNFTCLFCNHENSVEIKMEKKMGCGMLSCRICGQRFQCQINCKLAIRLSPPTRMLQARLRENERLTTSRHQQISPPRLTSTASGSTQQVRAPGKFLPDWDGGWC